VCLAARAAGLNAVLSQKFGLRGYLARNSPPKRRSVRRRSCHADAYGSLLAGSGASAAGDSTVHPSIHLARTLNAASCSRSIIGQC
jgi:hypothetical protein